MANDDSINYTESPSTSSAMPGRRLKNPLGNFSSYTYQLTLYMITPDAYNAFIQSGRRDIEALRNAANAKVADSIADQGGGAYVIAQSGGVNAKASARAPGFENDFYIDDLRITNTTNGKATMSESNVTSMTFNIIEPYGFSFISRLKMAADALKEYSSTRGYKDLVNASRQFYVLGIRFQGYDAAGNLISESPSIDKSDLSGSNTGGIYERFYDIIFTAVKFKIDGSVTTYRISAATTAAASAFGVKRGMILKDTTITASTVEQALIGSDTAGGISGMLSQINAMQRKLAEKNEIEIPNEYAVKFLGKSDDIKNASIVSKFADPDKTRWPMAPVESKQAVNDQLSVNAKPDGQKKTITFKNSTPIMQAISLIITQSDFMENALTTIFKTSTTPDEKTDLPGTVTPSSKKTLKWYNLSAEIENKGWDNKTKDFAYKITYLIQPYETPVVVSAYSNATTKYYGPHKRYEYWFTGKNAEITHYEQTMDNSYYNVVLAGIVTDDGTSTGGNAEVAKVIGQRTPMVRLGRAGVGLEAQNSYLTSLKDPGAYAQAKISILGDPDYLMCDSPSSLNSLYNQFYGTDGFTINANGGQVFIEIDFKEARDYDHKTGLLSINDSIVFWQYPASIRKLIKGVSYMVLGVTSTFSKGKFTQDLDLVINSFPDAKDTEKSAEGRVETKTADNGEITETVADSSSVTGTSIASRETELTSATDTQIASTDDDVGYSTFVIDFGGREEA